MFAINTVNRRKARSLTIITLLLAAAAAIFLNFGHVEPVFKNTAKFLPLHKTAASETTASAKKTANPAFKPVLKNLSVSFIDVGQGDSTFICCDGATMLIDAGVPEMGPRVAEYLKNLGVTKLDYLVGTHPDADHIGGLSTVINAYPVGKLLMTHTYSTTETFVSLIKTIGAKKLKIKAPTVGESFSLGGAVCTVLAPNAVYDDTNDMSIVLRLVYKNRTFLFTGDASAPSEADMLKNGLPLRADVLKVGHHGSASATTAAFLKAVSPAFAVISVGAGNTYGLPAASTVKKLQASGAKILRTDQSGTVVFQSDGNSLSYYYEK